MGGLRRFRRHGMIKQRPGRQRSGPKALNITDRPFYQFLELVLGPPLDLERTKELNHKLVPLYNEIKNPSTSLNRLTQVWNAFAGIGAKIVNRDIAVEEIKKLSWFVGIQPTDRVASIGSGIALVESHLAKNLLSQGKITCIDLSPEMSKLAEQTKAKVQAENMSILTRSGAETGLPSNSQDKVLALRTYLENTIHWQPFLQEAKRIIKKTPDARLVLTFETTKPNETQRIKESIQKNGFQVLQTFDIAVMPIFNIKSVMIIAKPV